MEARRTKKPGELYFSSSDHLVRWLLTTPWGSTVMREALASKQAAKYMAEYLERIDDSELPSRPAYVVVEVASDGWVVVYGERNVRAKIVQRPSAQASVAVRVAKLVDEWIWLNLPKPYRSVYYPSMARTTGLCEPTTLKDLVQSESERQFDLLALRAVESARGK